MNQLDEACKRHDIAYAEHPDLASRRQADLVLGREAGERFRASDASVGEKAAAALVKAAMAIKRKVGAGVKSRKVCGKARRRKVGAGAKRARRRPSRVLPLARRGGFLAPLAAAVSTGLSGVKAFKDMRNARRLVDEQVRHNRAMERIARKKGARRRRGAGVARKHCDRQRIRFL